MEPIEAIESLARAAREEMTPETDVDVRRLIREVRPAPRLKLAPLAWSAGISAMAACVMLTLALHTSNSTGNSTGVDSITPLFNAAQVQMP
jgi:hypothetical protein